jgi:hypothetical protein
MVGRRRAREEVFLLDHEAYQRKVNDLAADIHCGTGLARDLLTMAGGDAQLVRDASFMCDKAESMKAYIIDRRFKKNKLQ